MSALRNAPAKVRIREVGPRDGLQNEAVHIPTADKIRFVELLGDAGFEYIEVTSFVNPRWVPQLADAAEVFNAIRPKLADHIDLVALVPNLKGYVRARDAGVRHIALFTGASETFNRKNINASIAESLQRFEPVCEQALADGVEIRGYVSVAFGCPYEGAVTPEAVARVAENLTALGCNEIALGDTIGAAHPPDVVEVLEAVTEHVPVNRVALHMHDTQGRALENIEAGWRAGVACFDSAASGLGGCPYAPGAPGNVATEEALRLFATLGAETCVDADAVQRAAAFIRDAVTLARAQ